MKLVLHIGMHKTGSSSLQLALCRASGEFLYPMTGRGRGGALAIGQHLLPQALEGEPPSPLWDQLVEEIQGASKVIISSENFDSLSAGAIERLSQYLPDAEVMLYLRRQDSLVQAMYATDVMYFGEARPIEAYEPRTPLDYLGLYRNWSRHFPVTAVSFEPNVLHGADVVSDFSERVGVPLQPGPRANEGLPRTVVELARQLRTKGGTELDVHQLILAARALYQEHGPGKHLLSPEAARDLYDRYRQSNAELASLLGRNALFTEPSFDYAEEWRRAQSRPVEAQFVRDVVTYLKGRNLLAQTSPL